MDSSIDYCCPACRGDLDSAEESWRCLSCDRTYPCTLGFPDFRLMNPHGFDRQADFEAAKQLAERQDELGFEDLLELSYELQPAASGRLKDRHLAHFVAETEQAETAFLDLASPGGPLLDVGCGLGAYLACGTGLAPRVGVDAALFQLVLARKRLGELGVGSTLIAGDVRRLPFRSGSFACTTAADVIEHVDSPADAIRELSRILRPGGRAFVSTPNRFSLTPEPHVGIWGLGFWPRQLAIRYVRGKLGVDYSTIRPPSFWEFQRTLRAFDGELEFRLPQPGPRELATFSGPKHSLAQVYLGLSRSPLSGALKAVSPYFVALATRR